MILLFLIIPNQTEAVDYGWLKPATLPTITAVIITLAGILHAIFPKGGVELELSSMLRAFLILFIGVLGLCLMKYAGFIVAAPLLMLVLMSVIGERRWQWLLVGIILLPGFIWFCVDYLLKRPLP